MELNIGRFKIGITVSLTPDPSIPISSKPTLPATVVPVPAVVVAPSVAGLDTRKIVYTISSAFEGGPIGKVNFQNLTGNFDGEGYSIGFLQWCVGQGSDVKLFDKLEADSPGVLESNLGNLYKEFKAVLHSPLSQRLSWAQKSVNNSKNQVEPNWSHAFIALCGTQAFQAVQLFYAEEVFQRAISLCKEYGLKTNRAVCLMFDIVTQNGSIKPATKQTILNAKSAKEKLLGRALTEREYLEIIATKRAEASNPRWVQDVLTRKMTIVTGTGLVHGDRYDLSKMGLNDAPYSL